MIKAADKKKESKWTQLSFWFFGTQHVTFHSLSFISSLHHHGRVFTKRMSTTKSTFLSDSPSPTI
jgi:lysozyme family protein